MNLCSLCRSIDFFNLPPLPGRFEGYIRPWDGTKELVAFYDWRQAKSNRAEENKDAGEFSQPLGFPHHQSIEELKSAAENCSICRIIERSVSRCVALLAEAEKDEVYVYYRKKGRSMHPNFRLWLTKRRDSCSGFMVLSSSAENSKAAWLLAAVGFCVDDNDPLSSKIAGRLIERDASSEKTLSRASKWVHDCNATHIGTRCAVAEVISPRRVLDLEYNGCPSRIRLLETDGLLQNYTALSHVWGAKRHFTMTRHNIHELKKGIAFEALPKTFQDSISLTRRLGIRYLWIDSLCIYQDDGPDWERESAKMASIYENAYVVIAATASASDADGLFIRRSPPDYVNFQLTTQDSGTSQIYAFLLRPEEAANTGVYSSLEREPLSKRGWALQERYLAKRTLHFATDQVFFECYQHFVGEDGFRIRGRFYGIYKDSQPIQMEESDADREPHQKIERERYRGPSIWYTLLHYYHSRELTRASDVLPALSGIARTVEKITGDRYVAGLWRSQLIEGLLWQALGAHRGATKAPEEYRAPSWSWASIDGSSGNLGLGYDLMNPEATWVDIASIIDCQVVLRGENSYGEVVSGSIKLKAPIEPLFPSEEKEEDWDTAPHKRALRLKTRNGDSYGSSAIFDTINDEMALTLPLYALILVCRRTKSDEPKDRTYQALIVTLVDKEHRDVYQRVGKIILGCETLGQCEWMDDHAKMHTITLV
ncbi:HET-domain-containing protein [Lojkania enalia]|uniref:HET-domain-containing protein n=1 Tax=Lojkania enalia TaxID=147567 RepID=A0A9P4K5Z7_9PLEO|nr:HET-domain-containing protein [Didymosphaeria enalia]